MKEKREQGLFLLEFAIIAVALFMLLFAVIELSRIIWIWNTADEATRRGARVAAVCPEDHPYIKEVTMFAKPGSGGPSPILRGLEASNIKVDYLGADGDNDPRPDFDDIKYVRVWLEGYEVEPLIPFINTKFTLPPFETTIPSESLGLVPEPDKPGADPRFECLLPSMPLP
mgnify:CR=1 FL=1